MANSEALSVIKANGEIEPFNEEKIRRSIERLRLERELQDQIVTHVKTKLYDRIPTSEIFKHIKEFLRNSKMPYAEAKYNLKQAVMELGPTGYPFEDFVSEIIKTKGYQTQVRTVLSGKCVTHEIDIIAKKGSEKSMMEVKFHNLPGTKTGIHEALYTKARFNDVLEKNDLNQVWLITNTKISLDAITYGLCMGMRVISWNYPEGESLRDLIEESGLNPITALTTLSQNQKQKLLEKNFVLCKNIYEDPSILNSLGFSQEQRTKVIEEAKFVCNR